VGPNDLKLRPTITPSKMPAITWKLRLSRIFFINQLYEYSLCYSNSVQALLKKSVRPVQDTGWQDSKRTDFMHDHRLASILRLIFTINKKAPFNIMKRAFLFNTW
jgi:hypothetical protein